MPKQIAAKIKISINFKHEHVCSLPEFDIKLILVIWKDHILQWYIYFIWYNEKVIFVLFMTFDSYLAIFIKL